MKRGTVGGRPRSPRRRVDPDENQDRLLDEMDPAGARARRDAEAAKFPEPELTPWSHEDYSRDGECWKRDVPPGGRCPKCGWRR